MALDKCCFCCKLENGTVFMGFFMILINIFVFCVASNFATSDSSLIIAIQIGACLEILSSILLAIGGATRNHHVMVPWIVINGIALIVLFPLILLIIFAGILLYIPIYLWWCMCSAYQQFQLYDVPRSSVIDSQIVSNQPHHGDRIIRHVRSTRHASLPRYYSYPGNFWE